jgi:regulator of RNase E activity RraA
MPWNKEGGAAVQGMLNAIDAAPVGAVYVMVVENGADYAGIGGLMATGMKFRGLASAVIDASIRDTPQIRKLQFPVFSRGVVPSTVVNHYRFAGVAHVERPAPVVAANSSSATGSSLSR